VSSWPAGDAILARLKVGGARERITYITQPEPKHAGALFVGFTDDAGTMRYPGRPGTRWVDDTGTHVAEPPGSASGVDHGPRCIPPHEPALRVAEDYT
jgi:hypothetical protein